MLDANSCFQHKGQVNSILIIPVAEFRNLQTWRQQETESRERRLVTQTIAAESKRAKHITHGAQGVLAVSASVAAFPHFLFVCVLRGVPCSGPANFHFPGITFNLILCASGRSSRV